MKFVHMADMHLGMEPEKGTPWSRARGRELWDTFERILGLCREEKVDLLLIAGDLFHRQPSVSDIKEMRYLFQGLGRMRVVMAAGNHDYLGERSRLYQLEAEDQVMLLPVEPGAVLVPACNTTIYGMSYPVRNIPGNPLATLRPYRTRGLHILMAHGGDERNMPFDTGAFAQAGFDYVALGHIHKPERLGERMAYAGSPEPLDRTETGRHGVILGELKGNACHLDFIPMASREYVELTARVTAEASMRSLCQEIAAKLRSLENGAGAVEAGLRLQQPGQPGKQPGQPGKQPGQHSGVQEGLLSGNFYRIALEGVRAADWEPDVEQIKRRLAESYMVLEVLDRTRPDYDYALLLRQNPDNLIGHFIRAAKGLGLPPEKTERVLEAGIGALFATANDKNFE